MKTLLKYDVLKPKGISIKLPVIFLHGFYGCKSNLRHIANSPSIHSDRTCYLLDLRNHGDSFHAQSMHYNSMTSDIITFMNYVGINKAIWIGHSYGAKLGFYAACQYSSYVSSVIALDIAPISYESKLPQFQSMFKLFKKIESMEWKNRKEIEKFVSEQVPDFTEFEIKFLTRSFQAEDENMDHNTIRKWKWKNNIDAMGKEMENVVAFPVEETSKYRGPTYLLRGEYSKWVNKDGEKELKSRFPNVKITTIKDAGHNVHIDKPEETIKYISAALDDIDIDFESQSARGSVWDHILRKQLSGDLEDVHTYSA